MARLSWSSGTTTVAVFELRIASFRYTPATRAGLRDFGNVNRRIGIPLDYVDFFIIQFFYIAWMRTPDTNACSTDPHRAAGQLQPPWSAGLARVRWTGFHHPMIDLGTSFSSKRLRKLRWARERII